VTMMYLQISVSTFLTLFSARTGGRFFFMMAPGPLLFFCSMGSLLISTIAASFWSSASPGGVYTYGLARGDYRAQRLFPLWVWIYCIVWWLIQDCFKVIAHLIMRKLDIFGYVSLAVNTSAVKMKKQETTKEVGSEAASSHEPVSGNEEEESPRD